MTQFQRAALQLLGGALVISTSAPWARVAEVPPTVSAFYRMLIGGLVLALVSLLQRRTLWPGWRGPALLILPALFFAGDLITWHRSILYVGPGLATILANCQVFLVALLGVLMYRERPGWSFLLGVLLAFAGIALLIGLDWSGLTKQYRSGVYLGLITAACYAAYVVSMQYGQRQDRNLVPVNALGIVSLLCAAMLALCVLAEGNSFQIPNGKTLLVLCIYGVFCQAIGWILIIRAMPVVPAFLIGVLLLIQPAASFLWDVIFFARPTGLLDGVGLILVLIGIYLASARARTARAT